MVGLDAAHKEVVAFAVPKDRLVESREKDAYTLFSCSLAPGFDSRDLEAASLETIRREYMQGIQGSM